MMRKVEIEVILVYIKQKAVVENIRSFFRQILDTNRQGFAIILCFTFWVFFRLITLFKGIRGKIRYRFKFFIKYSNTHHYEISVQARISF